VTQCRVLECIHGFPRATGGLLKLAGPLGINKGPHVEEGH